MKPYRHLLSKTTRISDTSIGRYVYGLCPVKKYTQIAFQKIIFKDNVLEKKPID